MKRKKVIFSVTGIVLLLAAGIGSWGWKAYHQTRNQIDVSTTAITVSSAHLYQAYNKDEKSANQQYTNQVVAVSGTVSDIQASQGALSILLDAGTDAAGAINCTMSDTSTQIQKGDSIMIKGRCLGYLMDVNIVDATLVPSQNNK